MSRRARPAVRKAVTVVLVIAAAQAAAFLASRIAASRVASGDETSEQLRRMAVLNGVDLAITSQSFRQARFDLGMGGANLDLTAAALSPDGATIDVFGAMGGLNVTVPSGWRVTAESDSRTVGLTIPDSSELPEDAPHLHLVAHGRMSGVNVARA